MEERKSLLNYDIVVEEEINELELKEALFKDICEHCNCDIKIFDEKYISFGVNIEANVAIKTPPP
jgi:hypothetical protein